MRILVMGTLTAVAAAAVSGGLYFADGIRDFVSGSPSETGAAAPQRTATPAPPAPPAARAPIVVGKWEDRIGTSWTQEIRIVVDAGRIVRETILPDGRVDRDILTEVTPHANERKRFENPSSTQGQAYAITPQGHLAIFDEDGFVHQATKVTTSGEQP